MEVKMRAAKSSLFIEILRVGALAGAAGGLAEIGWIAFYGVATGLPTEPIARGVAASLAPALATIPGSTALGVAIHMVIAVALGLGLALAVRLPWRRNGEIRSEFPRIVLTLAAIWAVNFLVVLPNINPGFVHLLPYHVTLFSKLLFGLASAAVFRAERIRRM
jgi:hypothetical protein